MSPSEKDSTNLVYFNIFLFNENTAESCVVQS